jgi:hypothetical protein
MAATVTASCSLQVFFMQTFIGLTIPDTVIIELKNMNIVKI